MKVAWHKAHRGIRFNRYMVECEYGTGRLHQSIFPVLIDTWWNVNDIIYCFAASAFVSFNRYMVECEYVKYGSRAYRYLVLIDTWWNVNMWNLVAGADYSKVLIDTWWNVNASARSEA